MLEEKTDLEKEKQELKNPLEIKGESKKELTIYQKKINENYFYFLMLSVCFAVCYVLGTYKIESGVGVFVATVGELICFWLLIKKWEITIKKDMVFYIGMIIMLSIAMLWTDQYFLHFLQKRAILLLFVMMMLHQLYENRKWSLKDYVYNMFVLLVDSIASLFQPVEQFIEQLQKKTAEMKKGIYVILGVAIAIPLVLVIVAMLISADAVFKNMVMKLVGNLFLPQNAFLILFLFFIGFWIFYCFVAGLAKMEIKEEQKNKKKVEPVIAITFTSILLIIYVLFCMIQILYLFAGNHLPEGYTYSSYARRGFFELLFVSVINFLMIVICNINFQRSKWLDGILIGVSICNMILIASSAYRMMLYIEAYHLTPMRVLVLCFLAALTVSMIGVVYSVLKKEYCLFRYIFTVGLVFLIGLSVIKPHALIVRYNLNHMQWYSMKDLKYMMKLSLDAAPELAKIDVDKIVTEDNENAEHIMKEYFLEIKEKCEKRQRRAYHIGVKQAENAAKECLKTIE